jgi:hypothetical protein
MPSLPFVPLAYTAGSALLVLGMTQALASGIAGVHDHTHLGHLLALLGMVSVLTGVIAGAARPHRPTGHSRKELSNAHR